jgi:phospholipid N-methyltransferase
MDQIVLRKDLCEIFPKEQMHFLTKLTNCHSSVSGLLHHDLPITSILKFIHSLVTAVRFNYWTALCSLSFMDQIVLRKGLYEIFPKEQMQFLTKFTNCHSSVSGLLYHDLPITLVLIYIHSLVTAVRYHYWTALSSLSFTFMAQIVLKKGIYEIFPYRTNAISHEVNKLSLICVLFAVPWSPNHLSSQIHPLFSHSRWV